MDEHHSHEHDEHDHPHPHGDAPPERGAAGEAADEAPPDISGWIASAAKDPCPACGALLAVRLGGGIFCPSCGTTSTAAGYSAPPADDASA